MNENVGAFIIALLIVGALAGVLILGARAIADINQAQAEKAYAQAQQAREQTLQVQAYQDAKPNAGRHFWPRSRRSLAGPKTGAGCRGSSSWRSPTRLSLLISSTYDGGHHEP